MQTILHVLKKYIHDPAVFFVFPTDVAASLWADYALGFTKAIALERFIAWDTFKSEAVRTVHQDKSSIPGALRKLFAVNLLERNAEKTVFSALIPPEYASSVSGFADWLALLLPQLALWKKKRAACSVPLDSEDADLYKLEHIYRTFLDKNALFEPAWEIPPFKDDGKKFIIVYPEILQDFEEYRSLLEENPNTEFIHISDTPLESYSADFILYSNTRTELRETALYIRSLCTPSSADDDKPVPPRFAWTDIAVSVPDAENLIPYVMREFALYNIPAQLRSGKKLSAYPAGNLFALFENCRSESFSFDSVRSLLTAPAFPWKDETAVHQLIAFGIKNNCLCSYDGIDVWEQAFAKNGAEERACTLYRLLKKHIYGIAEARTFQKLRDSYFAFKTAFFNSELFSEENNRILSRCISELGSLIDMEQSFPDAARCTNPLAFFVTYLDSKDYLAQSAVCGVSVFSYKVAAGAPFKQHIILNASQEALNVVYRPLSFLHEHKRSDLRVGDTDISAAFVRLYASHSVFPLRASCGRKSFSGYAIMHNVFDSCIQKTAASESYIDAFAAEKTFLLDGAPAPVFLHSVQQQGFYTYNALSACKASRFSADFIRERILNYARDTVTGKIKVSASALKSFYTCPLQWLFSRVLRIEEYKAQASVTDDISVGILYHKIIQQVLLRLKESGTRIALENGNLPRLQTEAVSFFIADIIDHPEHYFAGDGDFNPFSDLSPLTIENFRAQKNEIFENLCAFFYEFALWFSGSAVAAAEEKLTLQSEHFVLTGTIDCILDTAPDEEGRICIMDFKTGAVPKFTECIKLPESDLCDFQLASYIRLYEEAKCSGTPAVNTAGFFSIHKLEPLLIVGSLTSPVSGKKKPHHANDILPRNALYKDGVSSVEGTLHALEKAAKIYADSLNMPQLPLFTDRQYCGRFPDGSFVPYKTCSACAYKTVCRTTYSLGRNQ